VTGFNNYIESLKASHPQAQAVDDEVISHHAHINQFSDQHIMWLVDRVVETGFRVVHFLKAYEQTIENHDWANWLIALERIPS
jgi:hypothetical protein